MPSEKVWNLYEGIQKNGDNAQVVSKNWKLIVYIIASLFGNNMNDLGAGWIDKKVPTQASCCLYEECNLNYNAKGAGTELKILWRFLEYAIFPHSPQLREG